jgi:hypothetical protein
MGTLRKEFKPQKFQFKPSVRMPKFSTSSKGNFFANNDAVKQQRLQELKMKQEEMERRRLEEYLLQNNLIEGVNVASPRRKAETQYVSPYVSYPKSVKSNINQNNEVISNQKQEPRYVWQYLPQPKSDTPYVYRNYAKKSNRRSK